MKFRDLGCAGESILRLHPEKNKFSVGGYVGGHQVSVPGAMRMLHGCDHFSLQLLVSIAKVTPAFAGDLRRNRWNGYCRVLGREVNRIVDVLNLLSLFFRALVATHAPVLDNPRACVRAIILCGFVCMKLAM